MTNIFRIISLRMTTLNGISRKIVLFDVDGVLLRNKLLLHNVSENIVKYVQKTSPIKYLDINQARHLTKLLYKSHGHTAEGLRVMFPQKKELFTNKVFSKEVYNNDLLSNLHKYIHYDEELNQFKEEFKYIHDMCNEQKIPIYLFTNSPLNWCYPLAIQLDIPDTHIFHCNHTIFNDIYLKPDPFVYTRVEEHLNEYYMSADKENKPKYIFIDDSPLNLLPIIAKEQWRPILYAPNYEIRNEYNYMNTISTLSELKLYL